MKRLIFTVLVLFGAVAHSLTLNVSGDTSSTLNASGDVDDASLTVRGRSTASNATGSYLSFSLANVPSSLEGQDIEKAVLRLWLEEVSRAGSLSLEVIESDWSESDAEYGSLPITSYSKKIRIKKSQKKNFIYVDLTELVRIWIDSPASNFGVALLPDKSRFSGTFSSKESSFGQSAQIEVALSATRGPRGLKGAKGAKGDRGLRGLRGLKGAKGDRGAKGAKGDRGLRGLRGLRGATGAQGEAADTEITDRLTSQIETLQAENLRLKAASYCEPRKQSIADELMLSQGAEGESPACLNFEDMTGFSGFSLGEGGYFIGANFSGMSLESTSFRWETSSNPTDMSYSDFSETTLVNVFFKASNLTGVNFRNAMFCGYIDFENANISNADFSNAQTTADCPQSFLPLRLNMNGARARNTNFSDVSFIVGQNPVNIDYIQVSDAGFIGTDFTGANVSSFEGEAYFEDATCPDGSTSQTGTMTIAEACSL